MHLNNEDDICNYMYFKNQFYLLLFLFLISLRFNLGINDF